MSEVATPPADVALRDAFGQALLDLAAQHPELVVLDADVSSSCKTKAFGESHPERFFNVGVAESHLIDMAAGLALGGFRPVCSTFALFLCLKGADQIRNTVCYNRLPVILAGGYGGLSDSFDGASHQSLCDLALMRALPNMRVLVPGDGPGVHQALAQALQHDGPTYIRLSRNPSPVYSHDAADLRIGRMRQLRSGSACTLVSCGLMTAMAMQAADELAAEGIELDLLEAHTLKPFDHEALAASVAKTGCCVSVEEHNRIGGLCGAVAESLCRHRPVPLRSVAVDDCFTESGPYDELMAKYGISVPAIISAVRDSVSAKNA